MALAVVKDRLWQPIGYRPHEGQVRVHRSGARHRVNAAGRRFGKSQVGGHELLPEAFRARLNQAMLEEMGIRMEFWIVGPNYTDAEKEFRVFYNDCRKLKMPFDRPGTYNDVRGGDMQISLWEGRFLLQAKSGAHPESLVGEGLHGVVMAEAAKTKPSVWSKYVRPTLSDFSGWSLWNSTPEGRNHFYDRYQDGQDPKKPEWESWRQPSWMNTFVFPNGRQDKEIEAMRLDLGDLLFKQEVECSFSEYVGRVYYAWDEEYHVRDLTMEPTWPIYLAADWGFTNPTVLLWIQVGPFGEIRVLAEYYQRGRTESEVVQDVLTDPVLAALSRAATRLYPDPEDPGAARTLADGLKLQIMGGTGGPLKDRITLIRRALEVPEHLRHLDDDHPERLPGMLVDRRCSNLIREMDAYRYPDRKEDGSQVNENPLKKDDHAPEALSRFFGGYFGAVQSARPRQRKARVG